MRSTRVMPRRPNWRQRGAMSSQVLQCWLGQRCATWASCSAWHAPHRCNPGSNRPDPSSPLETFVRALEVEDVRALFRDPVADTAARPHEILPSCGAFGEGDGTRPVLVSLEAVGTVPVAVALLAVKSL